MLQPTHRCPVYQSVTVLLYNGPLLCGFNVPINGLTTLTAARHILHQRATTVRVVYCETTRPCRSDRGTSASSWLAATSRCALQLIQVGRVEGRVRPAGTAAWPDPVTRPRCVPLSRRLTDAALPASVARTPAALSSVAPASRRTAAVVLRRFQYSQGLLLGRSCTDR